MLLKQADTKLEDVTTKIEVLYTQELSAAKDALRSTVDSLTVLVELHLHEDGPGERFRKKADELKDQEQAQAQREKEKKEEARTAAELLAGAQ